MNAALPTPKQNQSAKTGATDMLFSRRAPSRPSLRGSVAQVAPRWSQMVSKRASSASPRDEQGSSSIGLVNFYGLDFYVNNDVLTPRPETEQLIDTVLDLCGKPFLPGVKPNPPRLDSKNLTILDVGTGSGCIAITLKKFLPDANIYASDVSEKALKIAQKNASRLNTPISFIISYLLKEVKFTPDVIVANLPYVDKNWDWLDHESLKSDPDLALYAADGGLKLIKELIDTATSDYLILECDPSQHKAVIEQTQNKYTLMSENGFILGFRKIK